MHANQSLDFIERETFEALADLPQVTAVQTYSDAMMLTTDAGVVVTLADGSTYQLTIVQTGQPFYGGDL